VTIGLQVMSNVKVQMSNEFLGEVTKVTKLPKVPKKVTKIINA